MSRYMRIVAALCCALVIAVVATTAASAQQEVVVIEQRTYRILLMRPDPPSRTAGGIMAAVHAATAPYYKERLPYGHRNFAWLIPVGETRGHTVNSPLCSSFSAVVAFSKRYFLGYRIGDAAQEVSDLRGAGDGCYQVRPGTELTTWMVGYRSHDGAPAHVMEIRVVTDAWNRVWFVPVHR